MTLRIEKRADLHLDAGAEEIFGGKAAAWRG